MLDRLALPAVELPRPRVPRIGSSGAPPARIALAALVALVLLAGALVLRDSELVAVRDVTVTGATGEQADAVTRALVEVAREQTTLHVDENALRTAVSRFELIADVRARADVPHGLAVEVVQHDVVGAVGGVPVAADGSVLRGAKVANLTALPGKGAPTRDAVTDAATRQAVALLAAAPRPLRARITKVFRGPRGLTARVQDGPTLHFGGPERLAEKWTAATAVLAAPAAQGATSVDVRFPERPAAAGLEPVAPSITG